VQPVFNAQTRHLLEIADICRQQHGIVLQRDARNLQVLRADANALAPKVAKALGRVFIEAKYFPRLEKTNQVKPCRSEECSNDPCRAVSRLILTRLARCCSVFFADSLYFPVKASDIRVIGKHSNDLSPCVSVRLVPEYFEELGILHLKGCHTLFKLHVTHDRSPNGTGWALL
jgi:hypothetical protein